MHLYKNLHRWGSIAFTLFAVIGLLMACAAPTTAPSAPASSSDGAATAGRTIKIGYVSPQTGPLASFGESDEFILAGIRDALKDGIEVAGQVHPVEILVRDSQSDPNKAAEVAADLILKDNIDLMVVASTPETTNPVSDQCEANGIPCISTMAPWQPWFFGAQWRSGQGLSMDLSLLLGLGRYYPGLCQPVGFSGDQQGSGCHVAE